jgi:hypothetical protein
MLGHSGFGYKDGCKADEGRPHDSGTGTLIAALDGGSNIRGLQAGAGPKAWPAGFHGFKRPANLPVLRVLDFCSFCGPVPMAPSAASFQDASFP